MATDIAEKVRALIALSASDNIHEAKTAAYQACKLIREHKMQLSVPRPVDTARGVRAEQERRAQPRWEDIFGKVWNVYFETVSYPPRPSPTTDETPRRKFFCDGCKTECPATWQRGQLKMCERCRDDFDRVMREDEDRKRAEQERDRYRYTNHGVRDPISFDPYGEPFPEGTFSNDFTSIPKKEIDEVNRIRASMGFGPLTKEEWEKANYR